MNATPTRPTLRHFVPKRKASRSIDASSGDALLQHPSNPTRHEQALWRAVITQMLTDAFSNSHKAEAQQHKREAMVWLRGNSRDFRTVCDYAGFDPDYIRQHVRHLMKRQQDPTMPYIPLPEPSQLDA